MLQLVQIRQLVTNLVCLQLCRAGQVVYSEFIKPFH